VTLIALERLWKTGIETKRLIGIAASLGADVPFFLEGGTALGVGRGDEIYELADVRRASLLLISPGIAISAAEGYGRLPSELTLPYLKDKMPFSLEAGASGASAHQGALGALRNDLEPGALAAYPELGEIKSRMSHAGAQQTLMSGSGSTFFALFESDATRDVAQQDLEDTGWWSAPVETVSRRRYRDALGIDHLKLIL
jgi:4-diphosphocytidyl-2-C-methyl-D-erythritol kinase